MPSAVSSPHCYIVFYWPGQHLHSYDGAYNSMGTLDETKLWDAVSAAPSTAAVMKLLIKHAPEVWYSRGTEIIKNKSQQLAMQRALRLEKKFEISSFLVPPIPARVLSKFAIVMPGKAGCGKTCFCEAMGKFPYIMKTLDQHAACIASGWKP